MHTEQHISDDNDHHIPAGTDYMVVNYLEKTSENSRSGTVNYKNYRKAKNIHNIQPCPLSWGTYWRFKASYGRLPVALRDYYNYRG